MRQKDDNGWMGALLPCLPDLSASPGGRLPLSAFSLRAARNDRHRGGQVEILIDLHGDLKGGSARKRSAAINRARKSVHSMRRNPMMKVFVDSKESRMMMMEIPMMLDHVLDELSRPVETAEPDGDEEDASTE